jgi:hypothetical protein
MNAQLTDYYMAQQMNRTQIDRKAHQGWLTQEAAAQRDGHVNENNVVRRLGRRCGKLVLQVIGGMFESDRVAEEAIVPYR